MDLMVIGGYFKICQNFGAKMKWFWSKMVEVWKIEGQNIILERL